MIIYQSVPVGGVAFPSDLSCIDLFQIYLIFHICGNTYMMMIMMKPDSLFSMLSNSTRLRALMLMQAEGEVCVCELTFALAESQPKISRHLALLRESGIVKSRREGTWMYYQINPGLPGWSKELIRQVFGQLNELRPYRDDNKKLQQMNNRPERVCA